MMTRNRTIAAEYLFHRRYLRLTHLENPGV
jgi:hypothetical protein